MAIKKKTTTVKPDWTLIEEVKNPKVDKLFELYNEDKSKARIYYHLNKGDFISNRKLLFEFNDNHFKFVIIRKTYGISSTSKMYNHEKTLESIIYKYGKFYYYNNIGNKSQINALSFGVLDMFLCRHDSSKIMIDYLKNKFGWLRFIVEDSSLWGISLSTVVSNKLFNLKAILRHRYGCPYPVAKFVHDYTSKNRNNHMYIKVWKQMRKNLINIESLTESLFKHHAFEDSCRMAEMVGEKVNCSWGENRLVAEHDKWTAIVTKILLENEPYLKLNIHPIYTEFAEHGGLQIFTSNHDLIAEGKLMNHCVGTYSGSVNRGVCGIFKAFGYTLELRKHMNGVLYISQYMGYNNSAVPNDIYQDVLELIKTFKPSKRSLEYVVNESEMVEDYDIDLPF